MDDGDQLKQWEERRGNNNRSPRSSWASTTTPSSGTHGRESDFSPESQEKLCRPINAVVMEPEMKGTLLERLVHVQNQALKLCFHLEEELEAGVPPWHNSVGKALVDCIQELEAGVKREEKPLLVQNAHKKKGLKQLVKVMCQRREDWGNMKCEKQASVRI